MASLLIICLLAVGVTGSHNELESSLQNNSECQEDASMLQAARSKKDSQVPKGLKAERIAFAWYLGSGYDVDDYACAVLVAAQQVMNKTKLTNVEPVLLHEGTLPKEERFKKLKIRLIQVEPAATSGTSQWSSSFLKLRISELFEYRRVVYFDVDTFPLGNMDHLFSISEFPIEIAAPRAYWLGQPFVQSGGPMVIDPETYFYKRDFSSVLDHNSGSFNGEMDWVNKHFQSSLTVMDAFYALLIAEWCPSDKVYQHFQKHFEQSSEWVYDHAVLVHFIADWKPWKFASTDDLVSRMCPGSQPELRKAVDAWWHVKKEVC
eukprot:TRINITY_DN40380_c0_g1_i1.p1 TRINITY_DN40380_c0_g1~~TRINITY_DN40380_c0_g1_i1.p1  ORF type:complete len:319 (+),score=68.32 TRINITY_DN40380_c0_g1_i1:63-1019(+)